MIRNALLLSAALCVALFVSTATARDIFVNNLAGDDTFGGEQPETTIDRGGPVRTINKALRLVEQADTLVIANTGVPYFESIGLVGSSHSGFSHKPFVIEGNGAVIDGSAPVPPQAWEHYEGAVFRFRPVRLGHQQMFIDNRPATRVVTSKMAGSPPKLEPLEWCLHGGHIYFCVEKTKLPDDYPLTCAEKRTGITLFHVEHVLITDLVVQGFQLDGINAHNSARNVIIGRVTCRGNGRAGLVVGGASQVNLDASLIGNNGTAQLLTLPWSKTYLHASELIANTAPSIVNRGGLVYVDGKQVEAPAADGQDQ